MTTETKPAHISSTDETDLRWYFSSGVSQLEGKSNFGAMLDRLEKFSIHTDPCTECGGHKATFDDEGNTVEPEQNGSGFVWSSEEWATRKRIKDMGFLKGDILDAFGGDLVCGNCKGRGIVNVRRSGARGSIWGQMKVSPTPPSASSDDTGGDGSLARLGYISRILGKVKLSDSLVFALLESYYSPGGESEACLWHFTPAGKTMLRRNDRNLPERQFFENERNRQAENPNKERQLSFQAAEKQSAELRRHMVEVWCEVRG